MEEFKKAEELIKLKINSNRISWGSEENRELFSLKYEILFLISQGVSKPKDLVFELSLAKSNIALICNKMSKENLIVKKNSEGNRKAIEYSLSQAGEKFLSERLSEIEKFISSRELKEIEKTFESCNKKLVKIK